MITKTLFFLILLSSLLQADDISLDDKKIFTLATDEVSIGKNHQKKSITDKKTLANLKSAESSAKNDSITNPVLYPKSQPRSEKTRRTVTASIRAVAAANMDITKLTKSLGALSIKRQSNTEWIIITFKDGFQTLEKLDIIRQTPGISKADPLLAKKQYKRLIPNDSLFSNQWHLNNTGQNGGSSGVDANITAVWDNYLGEGQTIAIVDDGLEHSHSDLSANARTDIDHNWNDGNENDASPTSSFDTHGTSCAGVAAARGNNGTGVSGAAPNAELVGLRLIAGGLTDLNEAEAIDWRNDIVDIYSNSWGPFDDGLEFYEPGPLFIAAVKNGIKNGRAGKGSIYTWAGGNGGSGDDSNQDGYANLNETIAVGAIADDGIKAFYSEAGANILITAPSDGGTQSITTVAINNEYRNNFGGTSSATPLVSGVCALMLEANSTLGWRDVQEILIRSANKIDASDTGWIDNAAGFHFNHKYGPGMVDATSAVSLAQTWNNLPAQNTRTKELANLNSNIADEAITSFAIEMSDQANLRVEHARLHVKATHSTPGDFKITLISPDGTSSILATPKTMGQTNIDFSFMTVRSWGEDSQGTWIVRIEDQINQNSGSIQTLRLELYGTNAPDASPKAPSIFSTNHISASAAQSISYQTETTNTPTSYSANSLPEGLSIDSSTGLISGSVSNSGYYSFSITAANNAGFDTQEMSLLIAPSGTAGIPLAGDIPSQVFSHSGNSNWFWTLADQPTQENPSILQSGSITDGQTSTLQTTFTGPGTLAFNWAVSSEQGWDFLAVSLDGIELDEISGQLSFEKQSINISAGSHTVTWTYSKDGSISDGADSGFLDRIRYSQEHSYEAFIDNTMAGQEYSASAQPLADPDNDGINNLTEFFLGSSPVTATTNSPILANHTSEETTLTVTTDPRLTGISHTFQSSSDLETWTPITSTTTSQTTTSITQEANIPHATTSSKNFLRLKIEQ